MQLRKAATLPILDIDIENRPLSYGGGDYTFGDITAIAASWVGQDEVQVRLLGRHKQPAMLKWFVSLWNQAGIVTGHYVIMHDLLTINGALLECKMPPLRPKLVSDTKLHLAKRKNVSASQESLADMLDVYESKYHMSQKKWRAANRLTKEGILETERRVCDDVRQHKELRQALIDAGWLRSPRTWAP